MDPRLEPRLRAKLGFELDVRVRAVQEEFGGLLDRQAALLLVADEEGLLPQQSGLAQYGAEGLGAPRDVEGVVERLSPTRTFRRADGTVGFVADLDLRAGGAVHRVVLWDAAVREVQGTLAKAVRLTGLVERQRAGAPELHSTRGTRLEPR